ncbi:DNA repair protein RAD5B [Lolium perenne]|uniref:DNA repair protein RAD5B n=1 Tax=Lolium perenne TaxID=4522 RepID=UPI0021EA8AF9|nr:DNA repair protein RAD5B-like [Lolium perenne]
MTCDDGDWQESPDQAVLFAAEIAAVRAVLGARLPAADVLAALARCGGNAERAINALLDGDAVADPSDDGDADRAIDAFLDAELARVKAERDVVATTPTPAPTPPVKLKAKAVQDANKQRPDGPPRAKGAPLLPPPRRVKDEDEDEVTSRLRPAGDCGISLVPRAARMDIDDDDVHITDAPAAPPRPKKRVREEDAADLTATHPLPYLNPRPIRAIPPQEAAQMYRPPAPPAPAPRRAKAIAPPPSSEWKMVVAPPEAEFGDFPPESDWFLVDKSYVTGLSTHSGRRALDAGEIVHFAFPSYGRVHGGVKVSVKKAAALAQIVRFSTKRAGEVGKLSPEWTKCLVPLVNSSKVKIQGKIVFPTVELRLMQDVLLYVSFYIHKSVFTEGDNSSLSQLAPANVDYSDNPLHALFKLLKLRESIKADFILDELTRKRPWNLRGDANGDDESTPIVGLETHRTAGQTFPEQGADEQAISEAALNKIIGTAETYDLKEAEPPHTLVSVLKPYQKEALFWMSELEKGRLDDEAKKTIDPCFSAYSIADKRAPAVYINVFSGEATTKFPSLSRTTRGGILADAMGLGKTVMTIALILSDPRGEHSNYIERDTRPVSGRGTRTSASTPSIRGGTLIVCPMALLGQWKDELEAHSAPDALSVCVYYGGNRNSDLRLMAEHSVVLTTYGVLQAAHKADGSSVFHMIDWHRVVLDEAHMIKSPKTKAAQAAYLLSSQCRWCLTGTPLQNNLEDLYSLLCFLHVEPWCNANWWQKLIQRPYENGDERGLKLVKAILRPLMLRRTKETKDKMGNPILVLPPAHIEVVECEQTVEERDFYEALFRRSKVQFDKFVAQGNVLSNYANILELLLRLRQCCDHPFLVISKADTKKYTDLDELAQRFLEGVQSDPGRLAIVPSRAYVEEVVEEIRQGATAECPICLESTSDDPVLTPCAHRMCRECLLSSWTMPAGGPCPLCRSPITKADLINLPGQCRYEVDAKNNWKDSCKVAKLIMTLEDLGKKREKSIVFSQFTSFFDLLEIPLEQKGIKFLRFDGKLSQKHREKVLKEFSESQDKLVLLMSLKAGGVGLNLTAASNVFLMDPWWNPAVEEQAIMRIHRIGQKSAVQVRRFIVKDTVEERMQQVQARKQRMISGALTDEEVRSSRIEQLKMLFK